MNTLKSFISVVLLAIAVLCGCLPTLSSTSLPQSTVPTVVPSDAKLVCIDLDDGWQDQYTNVLPVLLQYNFKATYGIVAGLIGIGEGVTRHMGEKEIKELAGHGMDIASHSMSHPDLTGSMTDQEIYKGIIGRKEPGGLTDEQLNQEIIVSKKELEKLGIRVRTFIYPYYMGWDDQRVVSYVKRAGYLCARAGIIAGEMYDLLTTDANARYSVPSHTVTNQTLDQFKDIVSKANNRSIVSLTYHHISDVGPAETTTPVANFREQMRYLKEAGFLVVLLPDFF